jgi:hypothetical protein
MEPAERLSPVLQPTDIVFNNADIGSHILERLPYEDVVNLVSVYNAFKPKDELFWVKRVLYDLRVKLEDRDVYTYQLNKAFTAPLIIWGANNGTGREYRKLRRKFTAVLNGSIRSCRPEYVRVLLDISIANPVRLTAIRAFEFIMKQPVNVNDFLDIAEILSEFGMITWDRDLFERITVDKIVPLAKKFNFTENVWKQFSAINRIAVLDEYLAYLYGLNNPKALLNFFVECLDTGVSDASFKKILTKNFFDKMGVNAKLYDILMTYKSFPSAKGKFLKNSGLLLNNTGSTLYIPRNSVSKRWISLGLPTGNVLKTKLVQRDVTDKYAVELRDLLDPKNKKKSGFPSDGKFAIVKVKDGKSIYVRLGDNSTRQIKNLVFGREEAKSTYGEYLKDIVRAPIDELRVVQFKKEYSNDFTIFDLGSTGLNKKIDEWNLLNCPELDRPSTKKTVKKPTRRYSLSEEDNYDNRRDNLYPHSEEDDYDADRRSYPPSDYEVSSDDDYEADRRSYPPSDYEESSEEDDNRPTKRVASPRRSMSPPRSYSSTEEEPSPSPKKTGLALGRGTPLRKTVVYSSSEEEEPRRTTAPPRRGMPPPRRTMTPTRSYSSSEEEEPSPQPRRTMTSPRRTMTSPRSYSSSEEEEPSPPRKKLPSKPMYTRK